MEYSSILEVTQITYTHKPQGPTKYKKGRKYNSTMSQKAENEKYLVSSTNGFSLVLDY
jgi:hypothetical protein